MNTANENQTRTALQIESLEAYKVECAARDIATRDALRAALASCEADRATREAFRVRFGL